MTASLLYRISSVLLALFAVGHTLGFAKVQSKWGVDAMIASMRDTRFTVHLFSPVSRTYWDFYLGFGYFVTALLVFSAVLAWQLAGLPKQTASQLPLITWGLAICFVAVTVLSWRYFFIVPVLFSGLITVCLIVAAWLAGRSS